MKLYLLIPAYNEATVIGSVLADLPKKIAGVAEIVTVVMNDGSRDETAAIADQAGVTVLTHMINRGLGGGLGTGLTYARAQGADIAVTLDSDGQHDPAEIEKLIQPILRGEADFVVGSRLLEKQEGMPTDRRIGNWGLNVFTYLFFGMWTTDSQSGFRAFSKKALETIEVDQIGMEVSSSFFDMAKRNNLRYAEVSIRPIYTEYSRAKGQKNANAFAILFRLFYNRFLK